MRVRQMRMLHHRLYRRRSTWISAILALFILYQLLPIESRFNLAGSSFNYYGSAESRPECPPQLEAMKDILVVMKTGVTEALEKVPIHFETSFRCVPNYVIFSDFEEEIGGVQVHDVLRNMDNKIRRTVPDFDLYNRIREIGRRGLGEDDFQDEANSAVGKPNNPGWKLDKWKFLPMVQETLRHKDNAKWYVFMEADTFIFWPTLLKWLSRFDASEPLYIGTETQIADVIFAHGGSGVIISNPALKLAANEYAARTDELNTYTERHWAGDCVLGKVLFDAGVSLHYSWPLLQNSNVGELDVFTADFYRSPWCYPAVALHHLSSEDIKDLWLFERERWLSREETLTLHSDIFREYIYPKIPHRRDSWDNLSGEPKAKDVTFEECEAICNSLSDCVQFTLRDGNCSVGTRPRLGTSRPDTQAGWMVERVRKMMDAARSCKKPDFG